MSCWANEYIGRAWTKEHDCWYWFRRIQNEVFAIDVPVVDVDSGDLRAMIREFQGNMERAKWYQVVYPRDGDGVLMSHREHPHHIGVWVADERLGGVVHAIEGAGVVFSTHVNLRINGWSIVGKYRYASHYS